ncbi:uncharacterized protein LOC111271770 [Varroa jacobsoni]|nr:uncharacterized protein LOC111245816 isoform X3 [Varroa destructor]XP_022650418.1 uncharacterized protein LOC111245816 isoform X3 [Varroa destructor]XP_022650426.1 uncharacterized protein LOC111245816 isoform X3 [Varroa destructor]XP_022650436.1 uncharacterized protein LOC111245816 isoform X3 [Varroa destructor]XP_022650444.1 uncharacterized protein LOC111245816 isoform X3 [Varroa destructor]XP_022650455.1 uncharacterized protein LOC111245816 isoform X3 [Varroa destructor]XP_022650464.1 un
MANQDEDDFDYGSDWPPAAPKGTRKGFTARDDYLIIQYLLKTKDITHLKGYQVWKRLQHSRKYNFGGFRYQSLHERWRKVIEPSIERYGLKDTEMEMLLIKPPGYFANKRKMARKLMSKPSEKKSLLDQFDDDVEQADNSEGQNDTTSCTSRIRINDSGSDSSYEPGIEEISSERHTSSSNSDTSVEASPVKKRTSPRGNELIKKASESFSPEEGPAVTKGSLQNRHVSFSTPLTQESTKQRDGFYQRKRTLYQDVDSPIIVGSIISEEKAALADRLLPGGSRPDLNGTFQARRTACSTSDSTDSETIRISSNDESYARRNTPKNLTAAKTKFTMAAVSRTLPQLKLFPTSSQDLLREAVTDTASMSSPEHTGSLSFSRDTHNAGNEREEESLDRTLVSRRLVKDLDSDEKTDSMEMLPSTSVLQGNPCSDVNATSSTRTVRKRCPSAKSHRFQKKPHNSNLVGIKVTRPSKVEHRHGATVADVDVKREKTKVSKKDDTPVCTAQAPVMKQAEERESPVESENNETIVMPLRKLDVLVPWAENQLAAAVFNETIDDARHKTQPSLPAAGRIQHPRPANVKTSTLTKKSSPTLARASACLSFVELSRKTGTQSLTRSCISTMSDSQVNLDPPETTLNCSSSLEDLLDVSITTRCSVPLPELSNRWATLLKSLRTSVEATLRSHDNGDLGSHAGCPGLLEYLDMWSQLKVLIDKANSVENGSVLRRWRESRISSHISDILMMPMCLPADTNPVSLPQKPSADPSVICSQLRASEWRTLVEAMSILRDSAMATITDERED